jgi:coiled-coil domain-containing protein 12
MSTNHATLEAAATERKSRLAKFAALKRKQPEPESLNEFQIQAEGVSEATSGTSDPTYTYLSGRNYDIETRGPKLGFDQTPAEGQLTLEGQASEIARTTAEQAKVDEEADQPIDLFKLQPKKPNWDLKRHLDDRLRILNVRTENAIARLVRQRIENAQHATKEKGLSRQGEESGEEVGIEGEALVEGIHVREQEDAEEKRQELEEDAML